MTRPWPDEVRQMVGALMHGGACPSVYGCSGDDGWRIHTGRAWADYDERGRWWFDGSFRNAAFVLAELLQRSDTTAPAQTLAARILVAVPTARTLTTDDGIEVTVGSKSVRWKREKRGWSLDDDLFTSDDRVVEHAKAMAADAAPRPLIDRLREAVPGLEWSENARKTVIVGDGEPAPAAEQVTLPNHGSLGGVAIGNATLSVAAPQPSPQAPRLLDHAAFVRLFGEQGERVATLFEERKYDEATALLEALTEELKAKRQAPPTLTANVTGNVLDTDAAMKAGTDLGRGSDKTAVTAFDGEKFLDTDALAATLARASKETLNQVKQAHAAKGATTMTTLDQAKVDASEAALRTAAKQLAKAARDPLAGAVARHLAPGDDGMRAKVAAMLETEAGLALLKALLSLALGAIPQAGTRGAALAHELRVQAMADGADLALDLVMGPLREVVALYLQDAGGVAAPALDAPQSDPTAVDWSTTREVAR